jgi:single-strand DNA-binding protein
MAGSVNKVILVGHLGKDPETRHFDNGGIVSKFSLATTETFKDRNGVRTEQTEWHNLEVWGDLAKIAEQYLRKGKLVYVEGSIKTDTWEDNGVKKYATKIRVSNFSMLGAAQGAGGEGATESVAASPSAASSPKKAVAVPQGIAATDSDDLPF